MSYLLRTEHLSLRSCQISDLDAVHQLWNEADVRRFLFDDRKISVEEAKSFIETSVVSFASHGYGIWLFFEHRSDQVAGFSGSFFEHCSQPQTPEISVGGVCTGNGNRCGRISIFGDGSQGDGVEEACHQAGWDVPPKRGMKLQVKVLLRKLALIVTPSGLF